ncbi:MAG: sensor histidine kinase [Paracoccaceae bacterium]
MIRRTTLLRAFALVVIVGMTSFAAAGYYAFRGDLEALEQESKEDISWSASQLELELVRFHKQLTNLLSGQPATTVSTVNYRFDILWSRIAVFQQGAVGQRLRNYDSNDRIVERLFADMKKVDSKVVNLDPSDRETIRELAGLFDPYLVAIRSLATRITQGEERLSSGIRDKVRDNATITAIMTLGAIAISIMTLVYVMFENSRYVRLAETNRRLAEKAEGESRAKSKFLTMMSHELRTPMNGVLGMLALAKQPGLPVPQLRLIEQAERSGQQMTSMLTDILDFSALQDDSFELEIKPFEPAHLARAVSYLFEPLARREGIAFETAIDPDCPPRIKGDFRRLRQVLAHLAGYVVETAASEDVKLELSHKAGKLICILSFEYGSDGEKWRPELILGERERSESQFATDALGPAVARGLVNRMGGTIRLGTEGQSRITVVVEVPAEAVTKGSTCIRLETGSAALRAICESGLKSENVVFHVEGSTRNVDIVLVEAGSDDEVARLRDLKARFPGVLIFALGRPLNPDLFDGTIEIPLNMRQFRRMVLG